MYPWLRPQQPIKSHHLYPRPVALESNTTSHGTKIPFEKGPFRDALQKRRDRPLHEKEPQNPNPNPKPFRTLKLDLIIKFALKTYGEVLKAPIRDVPVRESLSWKEADQLLMLEKNNAMKRFGADDNFISK